MPPILLWGEATSDFVYFAARGATNCQTGQGLISRGGSNTAGGGNIGGELNLDQTWFWNQLLCPPSELKKYAAMAQKK